MHIHYVAVIVVAALPVVLHGALQLLTMSIRRKSTR